MDIIEAAIYDLKTMTLSRVKAIMDGASEESKPKLAQKIGEIIADGKKEIFSLGMKDKRLNDAMDELEDIFIQIVMGKDPLKDYIPPKEPKFIGDEKLLYQLLSQSEDKVRKLQDKLARIKSILDE